MRSVSVLRAWALVPAYVCAVLAVSAFAHPPALPGESDKLVHAAEFAGLGALVARAVASQLGAPPWWIAAGAGATFSVGAAALDELVQSYALLRRSDLDDLLADALGALGGAVTYALARLRRSKAA